MATSVHSDGRSIRLMPQRPTIPGIPASFRQYKIAQFWYELYVDEGDGAGLDATEARYMFNNDAIILWVAITGFVECISPDSADAGQRAHFYIISDTLGLIASAYGAVFSQLGTDIGYRNCDDKFNTFRSGIWIPCMETDEFRCRIAYQDKAAANPGTQGSICEMRAQVGWVEK